MWRDVVGIVAVLGVGVIVMLAVVVPGTIVLLVLVGVTVSAVWALQR